MIGTKIFPLSLYTISRIKTTLLIGLIGIIASAAYEYFTPPGGYFTLFGLLIGWKSGILLGIFEEFIFRQMMRRFPFYISILIKTITYILLLMAVFLTASFFLSIFFNTPFEPVIGYVHSPQFVRQIVFSTAVFYLVIFFLNLKRLLGPGILPGFLLGIYKHPRKEERIFLFLDIVSSTDIAGKLERENYFNLLKDFFEDLSDPVLKTSAQIYQYVGDEVVLTWKMKEGLRQANCIRIFYLFEEKIEKRKNEYLLKYGLIPEFKGGLHCGEVIIAEVGEVKMELVYSGEVLNIAARIRSECTDLNKQLLASKELAEKLKLPKNIGMSSVGDVILKGKTVPMELFTFTKNDKAKN